MAQALQLQAQQMGAETHVTPIIGKLRIQIGEYVDHEEFLIAPTNEGYDVLLGIP